MVGWVFGVSLAATVLCTPIHSLSLWRDFSAERFIQCFGGSSSSSDNNHWLHIGTPTPISWLSVFLLTVATSLANWIVFVASLSLSTPTLQFNPLLLIFYLFCWIVYVQNKASPAIPIVGRSFDYQLDARLGFPDQSGKLCNVMWVRGCFSHISRQWIGFVIWYGPDPTLIDRC